MPIHPLPVLSEEDEIKAINRLKPPESVVVRFGYLRTIGEFRYEGQEILGCGTKLIVLTDRGTEMSEMLTTTCTNSGCGSSITRKQMLAYIDQSGGKQYPFSTDGKVLRVATVEDLNEWARIEASKSRYVQLCRGLIREYDLPMKLVDVEQIFGGERVTFYFASEQRIDFRELVRRLAAECHTRIEMRQVGARDEARLVADYEKCGQHCCCKQFLKVLKPISMRSAKVQKATLDPAKISGRCGRLMCCLRYEDETYEDLRRRLPRRKARVMTPDDGPGTVVNTQILTQLALIELDRDRTRIAVPVELLEPYSGERQEPQEDQDRGRRRGPRPEGRRDSSESSGGGRSQGGRSGGGGRRPQPGEPLESDEIESREGDPADQIDDTTGLPGDDQSVSDDVAGDSSGQASGDGQAQATDEQDRPKRRRRRRRRRRGGGGGAGDGGGSGGGDGPPSS